MRYADKDMIRDFDFYPVGTVQEVIDEATKALDGSSISLILDVIEEMNKASQKLGEVLYQAASSQVDQEKKKPEKE